MEIVALRALLLAVLFCAGCASGVVQDAQLETWIWSFNPDRPYPPAREHREGYSVAGRERKSIEYLTGKGVVFEEQLGHSLRVLDATGAAFATAQRYGYDISITQTQSNLMKIEKIFAEYQPLVTRGQTEGASPTVK